MEAAAIEIGVAVAGEAATSLLATVKKHVGYLHHYKDNLNALQEADGQLVAKMSDESKFSGETSRNVRDVSATVVNWRSDAEGLHQKAEKLTPRNNITRLKPWSRYSTSKHASELTPKIKEKAESAPDFGTSFDRPIAEGAKFNLEGYMEFDSRLRIQNEVLDALRNDDVSMCSICGMGGMGKTMMAKKLVKIVENDGLFCKVAMASVTQTPNLEEIQKCIIESLQLNVYESTMQGRAKRLNEWLSNNKTLLVLDDVWWHLHDEDFEKVGIPLGSYVCKIFVTSRNLDECVKMGSKPNIPLNDLEKGEAWELFVQNSGKYNEDMARKIVNECKGLPIAIVTIAGALNGKPRGAWDDSLKKLQKSNLPGISDMDKVHSKIKVSHDLLNDPEAQSCLRLCCLFPEDFDVPVEKLVFYGWGLGIFEGVDRLKEARDRVDTIVHKLKSSFLLLDGEKKRCVKLHDIVRDFAIWISYKDENPYLVSCENEMGKWPEIFQCEKSSAISFVGQIIKNHPVGLRCPNLKLLQLHLESGSEMLPTGFFDGMEELRVVDLIVPSKLPPLTAQKALKTLFINYYSPQMVPLGEGYVKNIEILSLSFWKSVSKIPEEIGMMRNLRCLRLHFHESRTLANFIPPGVLSKLVQLEELELPPRFKDWGIQKEGETNASLDEIAFLPLTSITIGLQKGSILPENIVNNITKFQIFLETISFFNDFSFDSNILFLSEVYECDALLKWTSSLLMKCHHLDLDNVDLKYIMSQQLGGNECYKTECFSQLDTLMIRRMDGLEQIFNGSYFSNRQQPCFTNLTTITINSCPKLKRAFPLSMAQELTQLATMELSNCGEMEEVFYDDQRGSGNQGEPSIKLNATSKGKQHKHIHQNMEERIEKAGEREVVVLPRLIRLHIDRMPLLRVVYNGNHAIECPSLENLEIKSCNDIKGLSYQWGILKLDNMKGHFKNISKWLPLAQKIGIQQIKRLRIERCHEMEYLVDAIEGPTFLKSFFSYLEELSVEHMHSLEEIFGPYVPKIHARCFTNLTQIWIYKCPKMKHLFPLSVATELRKLKSMRILSCEEIEEIFYKDQVEDGNQVASSVRLNNMTIEKSSICCPTPTSFIQYLLPKGKQLKHLPSHQSTQENIQKVDEIEVDPPIVFPQLEELDISYVPKLRVMYFH